MSSLSFISLILLLTADTYFGEYLVCTPCAVVDNEVFKCCSVAGTFTATPSSLTVSEGNSTSLTCNYSEPASITWQITDQKNKNV